MNCPDQGQPKKHNLKPGSMQDEEQKILEIKILDDDEHEPDTYFDVELSCPTTQDSNVRPFAFTT